MVALAAAHQESRFLNYANDGRGGDLRPDQAGIASSQELPHEAVGSDHGSLGVFQQQWPWWGSMSELMDPATSASKFYERLVAVPGWATMPVTRAAQAVQRLGVSRCLRRRRGAGREPARGLGTVRCVGVHGRVDG